MNKKCQVFTPSNYVKKLLDNAGYKKNIVGRNVLENSCGDGNILVEVVKRYIGEAKKIGLSKSKIAKALERDIVGFEIDRKHYGICIKKLNQELESEGIPEVTWKIYNDDFLRADYEGVFDFIIGNPPYLTYSEMDVEERAYLKTNFISCEKGKFDLCYAFIEKSLTLLSQKGKMSYLIPNSVFKTVYGYNVRKMILPYLMAIDDYTKEKVFESALVKSSIIVLDKSVKKKSITYLDYSSGNTVNVIKNNLTDKWVFGDEISGDIRFGNYFKVSHTVATLLNEAFVIKDYYLDKNGDLISGQFTIESGIVRETISPKTLRSGEKEKIIFPYKYKNNELIRYSEKELKKSFPGAYKYLLSLKERLLNRDSEKNVKWFEYGRTQALANMNCEKCVTSTVFSSELVIKKLNKECIPYSGMYIVPKADDCAFSLDDAIEILKSDCFKEYVDRIGIHINGNSLRITSKDIENFSFKRDMIWKN